jgi:hypothetical protein
MQAQREKYLTEEAGESKGATIKGNIAQDRSRGKGGR